MQIPDPKVLIDLQSDVRGEDAAGLDVFELKAPFADEILGDEVGPKPLVGDAEIDGEFFFADAAR